MIVNKGSAPAGITTTAPTTSLLAGKTGAKFAGGNVTLVRSASAVKTPTKIAPAPPQSATVPSAASSASQPTSLLIKNPSGQVTMATLVQTKQNAVNLASLSPQKFVLRPSAPGSVSTAQGKNGPQVYASLFN